jgi:SAM-dependent methyltransferase
VPPRPKAYDRAYFDKWYRSPAHRVRTTAELNRTAAFVVAVAEYLLGRPVRTVLDVGAGEGAWRAALRRARPGIVYQGVDPSEYAVRRFGARRDLLLGDLAGLDDLPLRDGYDLVLATDVLNYLTPDELTDGLPRLAARADGMLYLELLTRNDELEGDTTFPQQHDAAWLRRVVRRAGLVACGLHCFLPRALADRLTEMERAW